jgi:ribosomal protein L11 methyltransferase
MHEKIRARPAPKAKYAFRVDLVVEKGTEEILPDIVLAECGGVWVEESNGETVIKCYPKKVRPFLRHIHESGLPVKKSTIVKEELQDYVALTKKYFRPITVSGVTILAPWQKSRRTGPVIVIDPGMAFGTGRHESTKLMLRMMNRIDLKGRNVLDVGCGSGILALRAAQKGALVTAVDRDPLAGTAARHNFALNEMHQILLACADLENLRGQFDVVMANLDFDTIAKHYEAIVSRVSYHGQLLMSGIEDQYKESLLSLFPAHTLIRSAKMNDWHSFLFQIDSPLITPGESIWRARRARGGGSDGFAGGGGDASPSN